MADQKLECNKSYNLSDLSKCCATLLAFIWTLHLNCRGPRFYFIHKLLNDYYKQIIEDNDRIAECTIHHGEEATITVEAPPIRNISIEDAVIQAQFAIEIFLKTLSSMADYDIGVDNMIGDIYERHSKFKNYFIERNAE